MKTPSSPPPSEPGKQYIVQTANGQTCNMTELSTDEAGWTKCEIEPLKNTDGGAAGELSGEAVYEGPVLQPQEDGVAVVPAVIREKSTLRPSSSADKTRNREQFRKQYDAIFGSKKVGEG